MTRRPGAQAVAACGGRGSAAIVRRGLAPILSTGWPGKSSGRHSAAGGSSRARSPGPCASAGARSSSGGCSRGDDRRRRPRDLDRVSAEDLVAAGRQGGAQLQAVLERDLPEHGAAAARPGRHPPRRPARRRLFGAAARRRADRRARRRGPARRQAARPAARVLERGARCARRPTSGGGRSARRSRRSPTTRSSTCSRSASCSPGALELPRFSTEFRDRPALIVVRGVDHQRDLRALRPYIRDQRPVMVGVDGGADAIREEGFRVDMIVGDMDSASEETLRCGAELVAARLSRRPGARAGRAWTSSA